MVPAQPESIIFNGHFYCFRTAKALIIDVKSTPEAVSFVVNGGCFKPVPSFGKYFPGNLGMHVVIEGKVISKIPEEETSGLFLTVGGEDDAAAFFFRLVGDDAKRQPQWRR